MKHADAAALDHLEELLIAIRKCALCKEKARGVFYRKSRAFLHFHEDPAGLFADIRTGQKWERLPVNSAAEKKLLLAQIRAAITPRSNASRRASRRSGGRPAAGGRL